MMNIEPQVGCANLTAAVPMSFNNIIGKKKKKNNQSSTGLRINHGVCGAEKLIRAYSSPLATGSSNQRGFL